mgnify:CR=1 FL=1
MTAPARTGPAPGVAGPGGGADGCDALSEEGAHYSRLVSDRRVDPVSGSQPMRSGLCEIEALDGAS